MKIRKSALLTLTLTLMMIICLALPAYATTQSFKGKSTFDGNKIKSNFNSGEVAQAVSNLQPGDDMKFTVSYTNNYNGETDWYLENEVVKTLEKTKGTNAKNGGYSYELIHTDSNGNRRTLFSNGSIGGEATPDGMQGLEQATNALDEWFFLEKLGYKETGKVTLKVALEGETQANDYMDTDGELDLRFAVEVSKSGSGSGGRRVNTGDTTMLKLWTAVCLMSAALLFILAAFSRRRDRKGGDL